MRYSQDRDRQDKEDRPYKVFKIKEGVVIDHIPAGKALHVVRVLGLSKNLGDSIITLGMNLESKKIGKKDVVKIENKELTKEELNKIALIAPNASVNMIKNEHVSEKLNIMIPARLENIIICPNPNCITRNYDMKTKFTTISRDPLKIRCNYCERIFDRDDVELK
ncbi:MAG: aspartate carbamoyltransferase regulatory subunit [Candidatus Woesearchaeota archaeon]|nr:aspartate carbamoyltransferase regulatory subunit [Candidatus Woesearchaeota archaeon]